ncbi:MAG: hypothetical protein IH624_18450 [Phycisphaerae bacterium]|nr:hypothetical protein [Phycisphaerae bacterium]
MRKTDLMEEKSEHFTVSARTAPAPRSLSRGSRRPGAERRKGSVMLIAIFVIALLSALVCGMLQMNTEEIQLMQNHIYAAQAIAVAEAGLNDALAQIRLDDDWTTGFAGKPFAGHAYTVTVSGELPTRTLESTAATSQGYMARAAADITVGRTSPYSIRIDNLRINE